MVDNTPLGGHPRSLTAILDAVESLAREKDCITVGDILESLGRASSAAMIFMPAVVATTPLSGIPGLSAFCGMIIFLVSAQAFYGRSSLWLPGFILRRNVEGDRLYNGLQKVRKPLEFLDDHTHRRLSWLTTGPSARLLFALCMLAGMMMPFLEFIPFSASAVAACVTLLTIAILTLDGALVIAAACVISVFATTIGYIV